MQSIQTNWMFSLSSAKPLEGVQRYREYCLSATKKALAKGFQKRKVSPVTSRVLESWGKVDGIEYLCCPDSGSLFLATLPASEVWSDLLTEVSQYRQSSKAFHRNIKESRAENVFQPKLEWIQNVLRGQNLQSPSVMEVVTPPSDFSALLKKGSTFKEVLTVEEISLIRGEKLEKNAFHAALLLESLDRVDDPKKLLEAVSPCLKKEGLLFVTALVSSGFDMAVLGPHNAYLFPPDRANCFSLKGLKQLLKGTGFELLEVSTPGVLDVEVVKAHLKQDSKIPLSPFERQILDAEPGLVEDFQSFLQKWALSSFARLVGRKSA